MLRFQALRRFVTLLLVTLACALFASGCDDVLADPNFQTWCGDQLCSWKLESGQIRKASTWHPKDYGVELLDGAGPSYRTAISQKVTTRPKCLAFSVVADVVAQAQVSVQVDFDSDGLVEYEQPIAAVGFREQKTQVTAPPFFTSIKFTIVKKGVGRAVLAMLDVRASKDCVAQPEVLEPQALGYPCDVNGDTTQCQSGVCCQGLCSECCVSDGYQPPVDAGADVDGDADAGDEVDAAPPPQDPLNHCSDGVACGRLPYASYSRDDYPGFDGFGSALPHQCDPGKRQRPSGAECLVGTDCTSGSCDGATLTLGSAYLKGPCESDDPTDPGCSVTSAHGGRCR